MAHIRHSVANYFPIVKLWIFQIILLMSISNLYFFVLRCRWLITPLGDSLIKQNSYQFFFVSVWSLSVFLFRGRFFLFFLCPTAWADLLVQKGRLRLGEGEG